MSESIKPSNTVTSNASETSIPQASPKKRRAKSINPPNFLFQTCYSQAGNSPKFCTKNQIEKFTALFQDYNPKPDAICEIQNQSSTFKIADGNPIKSARFYAELKTAIWNLMFDLNLKGHSPEFATCRADLAVAMMMQETAGSWVKTMADNLPYDHSKDKKTDSSQNVSIFNMNIYFIGMSCEARNGTDSPFCKNFKKETWADNQSKMYLNRYENLPEAIRRLSEGLDYFGNEGAMMFHRGGITGWQNPTSDEREVVKALTASSFRLQPTHRKDKKRIAYRIHHR